MRTMITFYHGHVTTYKMYEQLLWETTVHDVTAERLVVSHRNWSYIVVILWSKVDRWVSANWKCWNLQAFCQTLWTHHNRSRISVHPFFTIELLFSCCFVALKKEEKKEEEGLPRKFARFVSLYRMIFLLTFYASRSWKGFSDDVLIVS